MIVVLGGPIARWKCTYKACEAACCKTPRELTLSDIKAVVETTGMAAEDFVSIEASKNHGIPFILKREKDKCIFLGKEHHCELHNKGAKPLLCKMYPFMLDKVNFGDEPIMFIKPVLNCPGYGKGQTFSKKQLNEIKKQGQAYITELRKIMRYRNQGIKPKEIIKKEL